MAANVIKALAPEGVSYYNEASLLHILSFVGVKSRHAQQIVERVLALLNSQATRNGSTVVASVLQSCGGADTTHTAAQRPHEAVGAQVTLDESTAPSSKLVLAWCASTAALRPDMIRRTALKVLVSRSAHAAMHGSDWACCTMHSCRMALLM
jgi:hypothetical protein